jgi:hypothetical protein
VRAIRRAWQFQKDVREAYLLHRCMGETRRLWALADAWRTAHILWGEGADANPSHGFAAFIWIPLNEHHLGGFARPLE